MPGTERGHTEPRGFLVAPAPRELWIELTSAIRGARYDMDAAFFRKILDQLERPVNPPGTRTCRSASNWRIRRER
jgi:hypothetical protein